MGDLSSFSRADLDDEGWAAICALYASKELAPPREESLVQRALRDAIFADAYALQAARAADAAADVLDGDAIGYMMLSRRASETLRVQSLTTLEWEASDHKPLVDVETGSNSGYCRARRHPRADSTALISRLPSSTAPPSRCFDLAPDERDERVALLRRQRPRRRVLGSWQRGRGAPGAARRRCGTRACSWSARAGAANGESSGPPSLSASSASPLRRATWRASPAPPSRP